MGYRRGRGTPVAISVRSHMIKLTKASSATGEVEIVLEGRLDGESLAETRTNIAAATPSRTTINLSGLQSFDADGHAFLLTLIRQGYRLTGGSLYLRSVLEEDHRESDNSNRG